MKFQERLAMVSTAGFLTIIYLLLVYSQGVVQDWSVNPGRHRRALVAEYELEQKFWVPDLQMNSCYTAERKHSNMTISTLDLPDKTNFKVYSNKQYSMPHAPIEELEKNKETIDVIILPYSHVDAGWLRTIEEYYVYNVRGILNNMVDKLKQYKDMTFVWAETVFLSMWWNELDDDIKLQVRRLIQRGQLEIVLGGWIMADEASTHYVSLIDQLSEGHRWVMENLQTKPVNSWVIDPFGHSGTMPYLLNKAGMENMVIQRVHQAIKATLAADKTLEFKWRQYWDDTGARDMLCHVMPYIFYGLHYTCGPQRQICAMYDYGQSRVKNENFTGKIITEENLAVQARFLYEQYRLKASLFKYNTILVPIGDDFRYDKASEWDLHYSNYKKLMKYINSRKNWNMKIKFGTLADYFDKIRTEENRISKRTSEYSFPVLSGDFFPYSDMDSEYWTGYYSTRPFGKQLSRDLESSLRAADILDVLSFTYCKHLGVPYEKFHEVAAKLQEARHNLGLFLHHDAITGTSKPHVVFDYESKLLTAFNNTQDAIQIAIQTLLSKGKLQTVIIPQTDIVRADPYTPPSKRLIHVNEKGTKVIFFNSIAQNRSECIHMIVDSFSIEIRNSKNEAITFQINPVNKEVSVVHSNKFEIVFLVNMSPLAIDTYTIYKVKRMQYGHWASVTTLNHDLNIPENLNFMKEMQSSDQAKDIIVENTFIKAVFNKKTGMLKQLYDHNVEKASDIRMNFMSYKSHASGAYLFYPSGVAKNILNTIPRITLIKGLYLEEIQVDYDFLSHNVKLYDTLSEQGQGLHIQNKIDMNIQDMRNLEIIMRVESDLLNKEGSFYTDQNGYQLIGRLTDSSRRVEANYYPVTSMALIEDKTRRLTLHTGQSHGAASLQQGWLEIMLDRQVLMDDKRGLGEGVWDNRLTVSNFVLTLEHKNVPETDIDLRYTNPSLLSWLINERLQQPVTTLFISKDHLNLGASFKPMNQSLPCDTSLVSLKNLVNSDLIYDGTTLNLHRKGFQCNFLKIGLQCSINEEEISLGSLFPVFSKHNVRETTLTNLHVKSRISVNSAIKIKKNEIMTFHLES